MLKLPKVLIRPATLATKYGNRNMTKTMRIALGCLLMITAPMAFACDYPERPTIPNGSTAAMNLQVYSAKHKALIAKQSIA